MRTATLLFVSWALVFLGFPGHGAARETVQPRKLVLPQKTLLPQKRAQANAEDKEGLLDKLKLYLDVATKAIEMLKEYPKKRDELRAKRAQPGPIDSGFKPDYYKTAQGLADLQKKADEYETVARRFLHDRIVLERAYVDPATGAITGFLGGFGDAAVTTGRYLAACAFRYAVTGKAQDLEWLQEVLKGVYNLMTISSAPDGYIVFRKTGERMTPRPGLPVRGLTNAAATLVNVQESFDVDEHDDIYEYHGSLMGLPKAVYLLKSDISRDQINGLFLGLATSWVALNKWNTAQDWQKRISDVIKATMLLMVRNGYKFHEFVGKVTRYGDQSNMLDPTVLTHNLAWLGIAVTITGDAEIKSHYNKIANKYFGKYRLFKTGLYGEILKALSPLAGKHEELLLSTVSMFNFNLLSTSMHMMVQFTPDPKLKVAFNDVMEHMAWPLLKPRRVPYFDYVYLAALGKRDPAIMSRALGVLGQFRTRPYPFANPNSGAGYLTDFSGRQELKDPLFHYLKEQWANLMKLLPKIKENPFYAGGGIWPLGPGLVNLEDNISGSNPYFLAGRPPQRWWCCSGSPSGFCPHDPNERLVQAQPHDFLLSYWMGRYYGFVGAGATVSIAPIKEQARTVLGRVKQKIIDFVNNILDKVKEFFTDAIMRLWGADKKIKDAVIPMAKKMATELKTHLLGQVQTFWNELGPSLKQLPLETRREIVDGPWAEFGKAVRDQIQAARKKGVDKIDGWFSKANRPRGIKAFEDAFNPIADELLSQMDASYRLAMQ